MKKYEIVKEHKQFEEIINNNVFEKTKNFILYNKDNKMNFSRFGIAVGKKIGHAHLRNKIKRQIRMMINNNKNIFKKGKDYIIIVKKGYLDNDYSKNELELLNLGNKVK